MIKAKNYTEEDLDFIKNNYETLTIKQLCKKFNKSENSIYNVVRRMGLIKQKHNKWTDDEIAFLKNNYIEMTSEEMSYRINHTIDAINAMRDRLGLIRSEKWSAEEVEYITNNFVTMTHAEMGKKLNRTEQAIRAKCFDLDLYKKELPWTEEELEFVKNNYMEMKTKDIAKILNRTPNSIQVKALRMGLKKYPYTCDYHYFDTIDTEEKAYWLGFLTADGWINKNEKNNAGVTGIELQYGDINHLKKFNKSIKGNYQITDRWRPCSISSKDSKKKNHMCCLRIFSLTMYNSLVEKGFSNNKTFDFKIPSIRQDLLRHYIRGYFDGDGCFTFTNTSFHIDFITASETLNSDVLKILKSQNIDCSPNSYISEFDTILYTTNIYKNAEKIKFLDWIYKDCNIYLDRKYKKYLKVKKHYENTESLAV